METRRFLELGWTDWNFASSSSNRSERCTLLCLYYTRNLKAWMDLLGRRERETACTAHLDLTEESMEWTSMGMLERQ